MANILGLALKINADATQLRLGPVERALQKLGEETEKIGGVFDAFAETTAAAAEAQQKAATDFAFLASALKTGQVTAAEYTAAYAEVKAEVEATAAIFERGAQTAARFAEQQDETASAIGDLAEELRAGAIEAPIFEQAIQSLASVDLSSSAEAQRLFAQFAQQAKDGTLDVASASEAVKRLSDEQERLNQLFADGEQTTAKFAEQQNESVVALESLVEQFKGGAIELQIFEQAVSEAFGVDLSASDQIATSVREIANAVSTGNGSVEQYAETLQSLADQQQRAAESEEQRLQLQERADELVSSLTASEQKRLAAAAELAQLRDAGVLTEESYARLLEDLGPITDAAREAEEQLNAERKRAQEIIESLLTPQDDYATAVADLDSLLARGLLTQEQYEAAVRQAGEALDKATGAAERSAEMQRKADEVIRSQLTDLEKFIEKQQELQGLLEAGLLPLENYAAALRASASGLNEADLAAAAEQTGIAVEDLSESSSGAAGSAKDLNNVLRILPAGLTRTADLVVNLFTNMNVLGREVDRLPDALNRLSSSLVPPLQRALALVSTPLGAFVAALAASGGVSVAVSSLASRVERLANQAEKLGLSFQFIQVLDEAAKRSNTSVEAVSNAFTRLQRTIAGAGEESKKSVAALQELGITFEQIQALTPQEQYVAIGQAILAIEDPARRTAASIELFGRSGASLLPFFRDLPSAAADFERLGGGISDEDQRRLADFTDNANTLGRAVSRLGEVATSPFVGIISGVTEVSAEFVNATTAIVEILGTVLQPVLDTVGRAIQLLGPLLEGVAVALRNVAQFLEPLAKDLIPAVVTGLALLQLPALIQSISATVVSLGTMAAGFIATATAAGLATAATVAFSTALAATGIGALVVGLGFAVNETIKWVTSSGSATDSTKKFGNSTRVAADDVRKYGRAIAEVIAQNRGFSGTLDQVTKQVEEAKLRSVEFGQEGFNAAVKFEDRIKQLQEQLGRRFFNEETFRIEAEKARTSFDRELRRIEQDARLEIQIEENAKQTLAEIDTAISRAVDNANQFGNAGFDAALKFQNSLGRLKEQFTDGILSTTTVAREVAKANAEYDKQIAKLQAVRDEQERAIESDKRRVDELIKASDTTDQVTRDLASLQREITRTQQEFIGGGDMALFARLEELRTLQSQLETQATQAAQGFDDGFANAFRNVANSLTSLIERAGELGEAGAEAGVQLQRGIAIAQRQAERGILNRAAFEQEVAAQRQLFDDRLAVASRVNEAILRGEQLITKERQDAQRGLARLEEDVARRKVALQSQIAKAQSDGDRLTVATLQRQIAFLQQLVQKEQDLARDKQRVEALLFQNANARVQQELIGKQRILAIEEQVAQRQREATANLAALRADIAQSEKALEVARRQGDFGVARALTQRLAFLDQVEAREKRIAEGRNERELKLFLQRQNNEQAVAQEARRQQEQYLQQQQQFQQAAQQQQQQFFEEQRKLAEAEQSRQIERVRELNTLGAGVIQGTDIRTAEGASLFLNLAANRQDPALIEARLQTRRLTELRDALVAISARFAGPVVQIPGVTG